MSRIVSSLRRKSENYHMQIHALSGVAVAYLTLMVFPDADRYKLVVYGVVGSLLPDVDHFFYYFFYGKQSQYAQIAKHLLVNRQIRDWMKFVKFNHKKNTGLYSHNFISLLVSLWLFWSFGLTKDHPLLMVFFLSWATHYLFDIMEDILFFRKLNSNWYLKFNRTKAELNLFNFKVPFKDKSR